MSDVPNEYQNSKLIDYNKWSHHKNVDQLVNSLKDVVGSRKYKDYLVNMKVIIINLYYAYVIDPTMHTSYFGNSNRYKFIDMYNPNKLITYDYFVGAIRDLVAAGYVDKKRGGHFLDEFSKEYYGYTNKIKATHKLIDLFAYYKLSPDMICLYDYTSGLIVMKDLPYFKTITGKNGKPKKIKVKKECDYPENRFTDSLKKTVLSYNTLLDATYIDIDTECLSAEDIKALTDKANSRRFRLRNNNTCLDLAQKNIYRVFNNKSFKNGGRFYGSWWMGCPGELRKYIYINGEPTTELDYSGMHIHLLYALRGVNYAEEEQDPYSLRENDPNRNLNKLILLTALNAETEKAAVNSTYRQLLNNNELIKYDLLKTPKIKIQSYLTQLKKKHSVIAEYIASGKGIELQYYDSSIIENLIKYYTKLRVPILTVHDSVVCQQRYTNFVKHKMWQFYYGVVANLIKLNVTYRNDSPPVETLISIENKYTPIVADRPEIKTLLEFNSTLGIKNYSPVKFKQSDQVIVIKDKSNHKNCSLECGYSKRLNLYRNKGVKLFCKSINVSHIIGRDGQDIILR